MHTADPMATFRFGRCELLPRQRELRVDGEAVRLGGRAFDLLVVLVEERGKLVTKDEILSRIWPGVIVEENTLQVQISALRKAMGADRDALKTISGRGYRFVAEITTTSDEQSDPAAALVPSHVSRTSTNLLPTTTGTVARETEFSKVLDLISVALELAAACLPAPGVEELARRLDDRLRLLSGGFGAAAQRHQKHYPRDSTERRDHAALAH
jgi:DNA-binding winged helix-turn-helix (wHTH) protein